MANELLTAALEYAARGWPVFPCNFAKQPMIEEGVLRASTNPEQIRKWWTEFPRANIGMDVGSAGFMVLDLDPGADRADLERSVGGLPATLLRQRTPRGGEHLFYALGDGEVVPPSASKLSPHVDVRSFHSYVLLAPSRTRDGAYAWESDGKAAYRTDELIRVCATAREKSADRDTWIVEPDKPENIAAATEWLKTKARIAVEGQGGDHTAYATAAMMKSYALSPETAFDLMWAHWNPRCSPPWGEDEVEHLEAKIQHAYEYNTSPPGNMTEEYKRASTASLFVPVVKPLPSGKELKVGRFRIVDREGINHIQPPDWLIKNLLPDNAYALMFGAPGTFKSFLALDMALTLASGVFGSIWVPNVEPVPVLYAAGEGRGALKKRIRAWEKTYYGGEQVKNFYLIDPVPSPVEAEYTSFIEAGLSLSPEGFGVTFLDTVSRAMQGLNENSQEDASKFTAMGEAIKYRLGGTVVALHHTGHEHQDRAKGATTFEADADTVIRVDRQAKSLLVNARVKKQKDGVEWDSWKSIEMKELNLPELGDEAKSLVVSQPTEQARQATEKLFVRQDTSLEVLNDTVVNFLKRNPVKPWSTKDLAEALAMEEGMGLGSKVLQNRWLPELREAKGPDGKPRHQAHFLYHTRDKRWQWRG